MTDRLAYKLLRPAEWDAFTVAHFAGTAADLGDGFIHLSTAEQLEGTIARHYADAAELIVLTVDLGAVTELRWEPSRGGARFPHLYAPLPRDAVVAVERRSLQPALPRAEGEET